MTIQSPTRALAGPGLAVCLSMGLPTNADATFDGKSTLLCAVNQITACTDAGACATGEARSFDLPQFIEIDFTDKQIRTTRDSGEQAASPIRNQENDRNQLLLQGVENGLGWSLAVDTRNGHMSAGAAGEDLSYLLFGACINR